MTLTGFLTAASLALALVTPDRVLVASDSRTWDRTIDAAAGDTARKVDIRGEYAFVMTGWPGAFHAWTATPPRAGETARDLAQRVLAAIPSSATTEKFTVGVLRFRSPVDSYVAALKMHADGRVETLQSAASPDLAAPYVFSLGWDDGGRERDALVTAFEAELRSSPSERRMREMAESLLAKAASQSRKVGGPSHIAVIDRAGARWLSTHDHAFEWDGTMLTLVSGNLTVDSNSVRLAPTDSLVYLDGRAFGFNVANGTLGMSGSDGTVNGRNLFLQSTSTSGDRNTTINLFTSNTGGAASLALHSTPSTSFVQLNGEFLIDSIRSDGAGKVACVKADQTLGTCSTAPNASGVCTCS